MKILALVIPVIGACALPVTSYAENSDFTLEEVIITAQRKSESLQDAAIAVDASTQKELTRIGITNANGLTKISPALTAVSGGGSNNVYFVRGGVTLLLMLIRIPH
ncbi:MAG: hypothetical protein JKY66_00985 [Spongiibacteraceae bacterium]|nr:hypothetical protein [Spongiibacteraceae bacterium]